MDSKNYTIKDIARMAGVSAGTVDRVLHNRGDVSVISKEKVQNVLDKIEYHPNMFAIGLAAKKKYIFLCIIPCYIEHDYWHSVALGIERAAQEFRPFNVSLEYSFYRHADKASYEEACSLIDKMTPDAVLIAPNFQEETIKLTNTLEKTNTPYAFIDFNIEQTHSLCYIGQNSMASGYLAAKILMRNYEEGQELVFFFNNGKDNPAEIQMQRRLGGFMNFISEHYKNITIHDIVLSKEDDSQNRQVLDHFFYQYPQAVLGIVFNSRVYQVANYLHERQHTLRGLVGYDLLQKNVEYLRSGEVNYLIGQRPELQGYYGVKALCSHTVFKKPIAPVKYMPIDILMKENISFYFEFE